MADQRKERAWVKVQLRDTDESVEAAEIVEGWKQQKLATEKLIAAIRLYDALERGDTAELYRLFPLLRASGGGLSLSPAVPITPHSGELKRKPAREKTAEENVDDFMKSLGIE